MAVLIDSSIWIAGAKASNPECLTLKRMIKTNESLYVTKLIQLEVCQGARSTQEFNLLWDAFSGFEILPLKEEHYLNSAINYFNCRKKGISLSTIDCLIATMAKEYRIMLWSNDKIFIQIQSIIGFELFKATKS